MMVNGNHLEVDDYAEDEDSSHEVGEVGQVLPVERLPESPHFVLSRGEQMEECNDGAFKFGASACVDGGRREAFPHNRLAYVGGDKERDTRAQAITFLKQFVQK